MLYALPCQEADPGTTDAPAQTTAPGKPLTARPDKRRRRPSCPPARRRRCAPPSPATVGASNRARNSSSTPRFSRTRAITRVASSECPPRSKKLSWTPTRRTPQDLRKIPASNLFRRRARRHVFAAPASAFRRRQRPRSTLPFGVSGSASIPTNADGTMYSGKGASVAHAVRPAPAPRPRRTHHIRHQPLVARVVLARNHHRMPQSPVAPQRSLDLAKLDPVASHLHLMIDPAQELQLAVRPPARQIPGPVQPLAFAKRIRRRTAPPSARAGQDNPAPLPLRRYKAPRHADRNRLQLTIQYIHTRVQDRPADRLGRRPLQPRLLPPTRSSSLSDRRDSTPLAQSSKDLGQIPVQRLPATQNHKPAAGRHPLSATRRHVDGVACIFVAAAKSTRAPSRAPSAAVSRLATTTRPPTLSGT